MVFVKIALEIRYLTSILQRNSHEWVFIFRGSCTLRVLLVFNLSFPSCPFLSFCLDISQTKPKTLSPSLPPCHPSLLSSLDPNDVVHFAGGQLKSGTKNHTMVAKVLSSNIVLLKGGPSSLHNICPTLITECLIGDETGTIIFIACNEQGNPIIILFIFVLFLLY